MPAYSHHAEPPHGLAVPVRYAANYDGDTVTVVLPSGRSCKVRLDGVRLPELNEPGGRDAQLVVGRMLSDAIRLTLWVPLPKDTNKSGTLDIYEVLSQVTTFSRIVGRLFADGTDLGSYLVEYGYGIFGAKAGVD